MGQVLETQVVANELEKVKETVPVLFDRERADVFYSQIDVAKNVEPVSARDMRAPLELNPGGNFGHFDPEGGSLGKGSGPSYDKAVIPQVYLKHGIQYTKKADWATDSNRKAVVQTVRRLLATGMAEFRRQIDSQCVGNAGNGVVGTITSISTAGGKDTYTCTTDGYGVRLMRYAQFLAVYAAGLGASRVITPAAGFALDGIAVDADLWDVEAKQIRLGGTAAAAAPGDKLVLNGLSGANPVSFLGVPYHHDDASSGTWLGLNRANIPQIRANRVNAGGPLALAHARLALNKVGNRLGLDKRKFEAWCHPCQQAAYEDLGQAVQIINKTASEQGLNMYFGDNMQLAGAPLKTHFSWDKTRIDFVDRSVWGRAVIKPAGFYEEDGQKLFEDRATDGAVKASTLFYYVVGMNLFSGNPACGSYISNLTVPTGY